jgi:hypothetical protein
LSLGTWGMSLSAGPGQSNQVPVNSWQVTRRKGLWGLNKGKL